MSHYYAAITSSARKTKATARGHKTTGISGWAGSYEGVIAYDIYHCDGKDYVCVEQRTHPSEGFATVDVLYNGPLGVFKAHSLSEAS